MSALLRPPASRAGFAGMAMGVAAVEAVAEIAGVAARLKWPNDVVWAGPGDDTDRKLGGILAEADWSDGSEPAVVVGLGLNVNWPSAFPDDLRPIATSLNHIAGHDIDREQLLVAILRQLDEWCDDERRVLDAVRDRSATLGSRVRVHLASGILEGVAMDLTAQGHLVVATDNGGHRVVTVGDVVHLRPV